MFCRTGTRVLAKVLKSNMHGTGTVNRFRFRFVLLVQYLVHVPPTVVTPSTMYLYQYSSTSATGYLFVCTEYKYVVWNFYVHTVREILRSPVLPLVRSVQYQIRSFSIRALQH